MQTNSRDVNAALEFYKKIITYSLRFSPNVWLTSQIQINQSCRLRPPLNFMCTMEKANP